MEYYQPQDHQISPQTYTFRLHCSKCQRKIKQLLSKMQGVYTVEIDAEGERVTVKSAADPHKLVEHLECLLTKGELPCEARHTPHARNMKIAAGNGNPNELDRFRGFQIAELQELAKLERLKNIELVQTNNLKITFNDDHKDHNASKNGNVDGGKKNGPGPKPTHVAGPSQCHGAPRKHCCNYGGGNGNGKGDHGVKILPNHSINVQFAYAGPPPTNHGYALHGYPQGHPTPPPPPPPPNAYYTDVSCDDMQKCIVM